VYVEVNEWVTYDGMPYDPIQDQVYGGPEIDKIADFKVCFLHRYACNQKINGELRYSKTISKF